LQQKAAAFLLLSEEAGQVLGQHEPSFLDQLYLSYEMESKEEVAPLKLDLCQSVVPATDRRPFNKGAPTIAEHPSCCHAVLQPQAPPCDPA